MHVPGGVWLVLIPSGAAVCLLVIGALYMLRLAWKTLKSSSVIEESHSRSSFLSGAFLQFVNPKIYIYRIVTM